MQRLIAGLSGLFSSTKTNNKKAKVSPEVKHATLNTKIPARILNQVYKFVPDVKSAQRLAVTCRFYKDSTQEGMAVRKEFMEAMRLLAAGVPQRDEEKENKNANMERFKAILAKNCNIPFLTLRGTVVNRGGCTIEDATLLELAWGEDEYELYEMIQDCFIKLNADEVADKQLSERFPEEVKESKQETENRQKTIWQPIVKAITDKNQKALNDALIPFCELLKPRVIRQGKHLFYKNLLEEAAEIYRAQWNPWTYEQSFQFCKYILTKLQRRAPANYHEALCSGIEELLAAKQAAKQRGEKNPHPRRLKTKDGVVYGRGDDVDMRFDFFVDVYGGRGRGGTPCMAERASLLSYVEQTHQILESLRSNCGKQRQLRP